MKRENPEILPICEYCGEYKGIGPCRNPECQSFQELGGKAENNVREQNLKERINQPCSICQKEQVVICVQCGSGFCETHSAGFELSRLESFHQRVGTCIRCQKTVCEKCWILNPNGDIICLAHLEKERESE